MFRHNRALRRGHARTARAVARAVGGFFPRLWALVAFY
jgi:hypothetical protein